MNSYSESNINVTESTNSLITSTIRLKEPRLERKFKIDIDLKFIFVNESFNETYQNPRSIGYNNITNKLHEQLKSLFNDTDLDPSKITFYSLGPVNNTKLYVQMTMTIRNKTPTNESDMKRKLNNTLLNTDAIQVKEIKFSNQDLTTKTTGSQITSSSTKSTTIQIPNSTTNSTAFGITSSTKTMTKVEKTESSTNFTEVLNTNWTTTVKKGIELNTTPPKNGKFQIKIELGCTFEEEPFNETYKNRNSKEYDQITNKLREQIKQALNTSGLDLLNITFHSLSPDNDTNTQLYVHMVITIETTGLPNESDVKRILNNTLLGIGKIKVKEIKAQITNSTTKATESDITPSIKTMTKGSTTDETAIRISKHNTASSSLPITKQVDFEYQIDLTIITNDTFLQDYHDRHTPRYLDFTHEIYKAISKYLKMQSIKLKTIAFNSLSSGSVVTRLTLIVSSPLSRNDIEDALRGMEFETRSNISDIKVNRLTKTAESKPSSNGDMEVWIIVLIVLACLIVLILILILFVCICRKRPIKEQNPNILLINGNQMSRPSIFRTWKSGR